MVATSGAGGSQAIGPTSGGKVYAFNNIGAQGLIVAPKNTRRTAISFHNPGPNVVYIFPQFVQAVDSVTAGLSDVALVPDANTLGGCIPIFGNGGGFTITGECAGPYKAFAPTGSTNPLTVIDTNV
jgi:hypothetical protein